MLQVTTKAQEKRHRFFRQEPLRTAIEFLESRTLLSFVAPVSYNISASADSFIPNAVPVDVATADLNKDGKLDLVVAHTADKSVYVLLGNGNGTFEPAVQYTIGVNIPGDVYVGDFNNDGNPDLYLPTGDSSFQAHAAILLGNGDGTFKPVSISTNFFAQYSRGWAVGDFNKDGKLDLVDTNPGSGKASVMLGNGNGTFKNPIVTPQYFGYSRWVTTADVNGDGKLDLLIADGQGYNDQPSTDGAELTVLFGNGDGTFKLGGHYASKGTPLNEHVVTNPEDVSAIDINKDGHPDVVESDYDHNINVFMNKGDGTFNPAIGIDTGNYPRGVVGADVNGDGKVDLVVTNGGVGPGGNRFLLTGEDEPGSVAVLYGNGNGTFKTPVLWGPFDFPEHTAVGDFDGNGRPDLGVTQVRDGHLLDVMLNSTTVTNQPPTIATDLAASPNPVTAKTTNLSVLGTDDGGAANLTYNWSAWTTVNGVDSPANVTFSANHTNAAKSAIATFPSAGGFSLRVAITDASGQTVWAVVDVNVKQTFTSITVTPANPSLPAGSTKQFIASAKDQFGNTLSTQPSFSWSVSGGGTINSSGLFAAGSSAGGPFTVTATSGSIKGATTVTITGAFVWTGGGTTNNWSDANNWSTKAVPNSSATVLFNSSSSKNSTIDSSFAGTVATINMASGYAGTITLGRSLTLTGSFIESSGTFSEGSNTLFVAGDFTKTGGTFSAGAGTVTMNGTAANQNLSAAGVGFYNFTLANTVINNVYHSLNVTGTLTVNHTFTWLRTAGPILGPSGTGNASIESKGDVDNQNHGATGNPYFTLDGSGNQTIKDTSGVNNYSGFPGGDFRGLTINKPSGSVILACDPLIYNGLSLVKGSVTSGSNWWYVSDTSNTAVISSAAGTNLGNITLASNLPAGAISNNLQVTNLNLNGHSFVAPANLYISGNFSAGASGSLFTANGGTVILNGAGNQQQLTSGGNAFNNLTINSGALVQEEDDLVITGLFTNNGTLDKNGHKLNGK